MKVLVETDVPPLDFLSELLIKKRSNFVKYFIDFFLR